MQRHVLLAASLLATACTVTAAAQTPTTPLTGNTPTAPLTYGTPSFPIPPSKFSTNAQIAPLGQKILHHQSNNSFIFNGPGSNVNALASVPKPDKSAFSFSLEQPAQLALSSPHGPIALPSATTCYTLRVYGFTPQDVKSRNPHSSSESDCIPASRSHLKALQLEASPIKK